MDYKDFSENQEIEYTCTVTVNGEDAGTISSFSESGLLEDFRKLDYAIKDKIDEFWNDLPENQEDEEDYDS